MIEKRVIQVEVSERRAVVLEYLSKECGQIPAVLAEHFLGLALDSERIRLALASAPPPPRGDDVKFYDDRWIGIDGKGHGR